MGYVDGTSAIASSIATNALKPRSALLASAVSMFIAPLFFIVLLQNDSVARTVGSMVYIDSFATINQIQGFVFLISALLGAIVWAIISTILAVPNSVSHILLGGIVGAGIAMFGVNSIDWNSVGIKVVLMVFLAPILGIIAGYLLQKLFVLLCRSWPRAMKRLFKYLQRLNVVLLSFSISANNIQKSLGVFLLAMVLCSGNGISFDSYQFAWWIVIIFAILQCLGLLFGGENPPGSGVHDPAGSEIDFRFQLQRHVHDRAYPGDSELRRFQSENRGAREIGALGGMCHERIQAFCLRRVRRRTAVAVGGGRDG